MTNFIKHFIALHEANIENNNWENVYTADAWTDHIHETGAFTEMLLDCGIDPLENCRYIPGFYLYGSTHEHEITIPEHIDIIHGLCFYQAKYLKRLYLHTGIKEIKISAFTDCSSELGDELEIIYPGTVEQWRQVKIHPQANLPRFYKVKTVEGWTR